MVFLRVFLVTNQSRWRSKRATDMQHLRTWEPHQQQRLDMSWWRNNYRRRLELHTLEVLLPSNANSKCGGGTWLSQVSSFLTNSYHALELVLALAPCSIKKVLLSTLIKALPGGRPRITRFMLMLISLRIKFNRALCILFLSLYALCLNVCLETHS